MMNVYAGNTRRHQIGERWNCLNIIKSTTEMQLLVYMFRTVDLLLKSSFDTYPIHCSVLLFFAVGSVVAMLVFVVVVAVAAVVAALRASRKQSMYSSSLASVLENSVAGL
jgi:hypothetical protein